MTAMGKAEAKRWNGEFNRDAADAIAEMQRTCHARAVMHGWYDGSEEVTPDRFGSRIALICSEASEALEAYRDGVADNVDEWPSGAKPVGVASELADVVIRVFDLAEWMGIDLGAALVAKHFYNGTRSYRHNGKKL